MHNTTKKFRRQIRTFLSTSPTFYLPLRRLSTKFEGNLFRSTEILIDGFPRCGNSFAEAAFRLAQSKPVTIAHHSHAAAQVIQAARWGVPSIVLVRDPMEAARSLIMHEPNVYDAETALDAYFWFYKSIEPWFGKFVIARFKIVTTNFGAIIDAVNARFGTNFDSFRHTHDNEFATYDLIDELSRKRGTIHEGEVEPYSPRTSEEQKRRRELEKKQARDQVIGCKLSMERAQEVYEKIIAESDA